MTLNEVIDFICEEINLRDRSKNGVDICLPILVAQHHVYKLIELFSINDETISFTINTSGSVVLRWAETKEKHALWWRERLFPPKNT